jgi:hypothetical protein
LLKEVGNEATVPLKKLTSERLSKSARHKKDCCNAGLQRRKNPEKTLDDLPPDYDDEIILVDDCSTDKPWRLRRIRLVA